MAVVCHRDEEHVVRGGSEKRRTNNVPSEALKYCRTLAPTLQADFDYASISHNISVSLSQHAPDCVSSKVNFSTSNNNMLSGKSIHKDYLFFENAKLLQDIAQLNLGIE
ncbi:hypothetical protein ACFE04_002226 [Oxalis oulophora]